MTRRIAISFACGCAVSLLSFAITVVFSPSGFVGSVIGGFQLPGIASAEHVFALIPKRAVVVTVMILVNALVYTFVVLVALNAIEQRKASDSVAR